MADLVTASSVIGRLRYSCKYPSCKNSFYSNIIRMDYKNKKFHSFPKHSKNLQIWKNVCKLSPTKQCTNFHICEDHFRISDYNNPNEPIRLSRDAIPHSPLKYQEVIFDEHLENNASFNFQPRILFPVNNDVSICTDNRPLEQYDNEAVTVTAPPTFIEKESNSQESNLSVLCDLSYNIPLPKPKGNSKCSKMATDQYDRYSFLSENRKGILTKAGLCKKDLTPQENIMYLEHRAISSKLSKLRTLLKNERAHVNSLKNLYNDGRFQFIEECLNDVTKDFINSQLRNAVRSSSGRRWTIRDKAFALSIYKRSPRLYRYLRAYFQLPSIQTLKNVLASIPFECGTIKPVLEHLKLQTEKMDELDRCCTLIFDEVSLSRGFYYNSHQQKVYGFEDLGTHGRNENVANHALVFMVRGIKKNYKMPVAFFFTANTIKTNVLKDLIVDIITQLQEVGLNIVATVCDQGPTNRAAIKALTREHSDDNPSPYHFVVNDERIFTIFDIPHLL